MVGTAHHPMASKGRRGDTLMAHVTPGEAIVPKQVLDANPEIAHLIAQAIRNAGADPEQYKVGAGMSHNPETGQPEFGFFSKILKNKAFRVIAPIALSAFAPGIGTAIGTSLGATGAAASALGNAAIGAGLGAAGGGGLKGAVTGGVTGGIGGYVSGVGGIENAIGSTLNKAGFGNAAYGLLDGAGSGIFGGAGNLLQAASLGSSLFGSAQNNQAIESQKIASPSAAPFSPKRPEAMATPKSLAELSSFDPSQQRSALATKGVNGGLGDDENSYYRNLLQRSLIGDGNKVDTSNPNFLIPIESTYFSQQGKNTSDVMKFLQGIG